MIVRRSVSGTSPASKRILWLRQLALHQCTSFLWQPVKPHANSVARITVNDIALDYDLLTGEGNPQRQRRPFGKLRLSAEVQPAQANVLAAGDAGRVRAIEMNIHNQSRAVELASLVG